MSVPRPYLFCPTLDHQMAAVRTLYALGYVNPYSSLDGTLTDMIGRPDDFMAYPYVGVAAESRPNEIDWKKAMVPGVTTVNSVVHLKAYMVRHGMVLTPGAPPA